MHNQTGEVNKCNKAGEKGYIFRRRFKWEEKGVKTKMAVVEEIPSVDSPTTGCLHNRAPTVPILFLSLVYSPFSLKAFEITKDT